MLDYNRIDVSEGICVFKWNELKECMICQYCYFLDCNYKHEPETCDGSHDISVIWVKNIAILNIKGGDYRCAICNVTRNDAINIFNNPKLDHKGSLWIWILVQIKHQ